MPSRIRSSRTCTCAQFLHIAGVVAYVVERQELEQMSKLSTMGVRPIEGLVISILEEEANKGKN